MYTIIPNEDRTYSLHVEGQEYLKDAKLGEIINEIVVMESDVQDPMIDDEVEELNFDHNDIN